MMGRRRIEHHEPHGRSGNRRLHRANVDLDRSRLAKSLAKLIADSRVECDAVERPAFRSSCNRDLAAINMSIEAWELRLDFDLALLECGEVQGIAKEELPGHSWTAAARLVATLQPHKMQRSIGLEAETLRLGCWTRAFCRFEACAYRNTDRCPARQRLLCIGACPRHHPKSQVPVFDGAPDQTGDVLIRGD